MSSSSEWRYYTYEPSHALALATMGVFFAAFLGHCYLMWRKRAWYMWPFTVGVLGEACGYIFRRVSADHPTGRGAGLLWYILQSLFIILAPALMAASIYMIFGRLCMYVGETYSPVRASRVTAIFVSFDVLSFVIQGAGGSLYSSDNRDIYPAAKAILIVGFCVQIIALGIFFLFAIIYQIRARRAGEHEGKWTVCLYTLYVGCVMILVRGIFRTIEYGTGGGGGTGYLLEREAWYYGLETLPIAICSYVFLVSHPARYIPSDRSVRLHPERDALPTPTSDEEKNLDGDGIGKSRRWYLAGMKR